MSEEVYLYNVREVVLDSSGRVLATIPHGSFKFAEADYLARHLRHTLKPVPGRIFDVSLIPCRTAGDERKKGGRDGER